MVSTNHFRNRRLTGNQRALISKGCDCPLPATPAPPPANAPLLQLYLDWKLTDGINFFTLPSFLGQMTYTTDVDSATNGRTLENNADWLITALTKSSSGEFILDLYLTPDGDVQHHAATITYAAAPTWQYEIQQATAPADDWAITVVANVIAAAANIIG